MVFSSFLLRLFLTLRSKGAQRLNSSLIIFQKEKPGTQRLECFVQSHSHTVTEYQYYFISALKSSWVFFARIIFKQNSLWVQLNPRA